MQEFYLDIYYADKKIAALWLLIISIAIWEPLSTVHYPPSTNHSPYHQLLNQVEASVEEVW
jgi:hypothetical protein